jgi:hypothetical protein
VVFSPKGANILLKEGCKVSGTIVATGSPHKGMYRLVVSEKQQAHLTNVKENVTLWHRRLGHLHHKAMDILKKKKLAYHIVMK